MQARPGSDTVTLANRAKAGVSESVYSNVGAHLQRQPDCLTITTVLVVSNNLFAGQPQFGTRCPSPCSGFWIRALNDCTIEGIVRIHTCLIDDLQHFAMTCIEVSVHK
ncbi:hypothetical protein ASL20_23120 [Cupriavidus necator]|nr:hypothetical protein ASL20_23120 [Cupriavidus necator]